METVLEYKFAADTIGNEQVLITNCDQEPLKHSGLKTEPRKALEFLPFERSVLLDSEATDPLVSSDINRFDYFIVGGILGNGTVHIHTHLNYFTIVDEFDADKTSVLRNTGIATRNIGHFQMTMDTAAICCKLILKDSMSFHEIPFIDRPTIVLSDQERVQLDFRYIKNQEDDQPLMSSEILKLLKSEDALDVDLLE